MTSQYIDHLTAQASESAFIKGALTPLMSSLIMSNIFTALNQQPRWGKNIKQGPIITSTQQMFICHLCRWGGLIHLIFSWWHHSEMLNVAKWCNGSIITFMRVFFFFCLSWFQQSPWSRKHTNKSHSTTPTVREHNDKYENTVNTGLTQWILSNAYEMLLYQPISDLLISAVSTTFIPLLSCVSLFSFAPSKSWVVPLLSHCVEGWWWGSFHCDQQRWCVPTDGEKGERCRHGDVWATWQSENMGIQWQPGSDGLQPSEYRVTCC